MSDEDDVEGDPATDADADADADPEIVAAPAHKVGSAVALTDGNRRAHLSIVSFDPAGRATVLEHSFVVEAECHGWRLDRFLMKRMRRLSRTRLQRVIRGDLDINGAKEDRPGASVQTGQVVSFRRPAPVEPDVPRIVPILVDDPAFYAFEKPAGLPIHPTARYHYSTLTAVLRERHPGENLEVAHRLDRETSGVLLVGKNRDDFRAGAILKRAFARRLVEKTYLAIVHGRLTESVVVDAPLAAAGTEVRVRMGVIPVDKGGLPSRTRIVPVAVRGDYSLVEAHPETGRQHQIRVHLAHVGFPIVGDKLYPNEDRFLEWLEHGDTPGLLALLQLPRHALHAHALVFPHPRTQTATRIESPLAPDLAAFFAAIA